MMRLSHHIRMQIHYVLSISDPRAPGLAEETSASPIGHILFTSPPQKPQSGKLSDFKRTLDIQFAHVLFMQHVSMFTGHRPQQLPDRCSWTFSHLRRKAVQKSML